MEGGNRKSSGCRSPELSEWLNGYQSDFIRVLIIWHKTKPTKVWACGSWTMTRGSNWKSQSVICCHYGHHINRTMIIHSKYEFRGVNVKYWEVIKIFLWFYYNSDFTIKSKISIHDKIKTFNLLTKTARPNELYTILNYKWNEPRKSHSHWSQFSGHLTCRL